MKNLLGKIAALVIAPSAMVATGAGATEQAWRAAVDDGSIAAYAQVALDHPELSDAARDAIAETGTSRIETAALATDSAPDAASSFIRDIQII